MGWMPARGVGQTRGGHVFVATDTLETIAVNEVAHGAKRTGTLVRRRPRHAALRAARHAAQEISEPLSLAWVERHGRLGAVAFPDAESDVLGTGEVDRHAEPPVVKLLRPLEVLHDFDPLRSSTSRTEPEVVLDLATTTSARAHHSASFCGFLRPLLCPSRPPVKPSGNCAEAVAFDSLRARLRGADSRSTWSSCRLLLRRTLMSGLAPPNRPLFDCEHQPHDQRRCLLHRRDGVRVGVEPRPAGNACLINWKGESWDSDACSCA